MRGRRGPMRGRRGPMRGRRGPMRGRPRDAARVPRTPRSRPTAGPAVMRQPSPTVSRRMSIELVDARDGGVGAGAFRCAGSRGPLDGRSQDQYSLVADLATHASGDSYGSSAGLSGWRILDTRPCIASSERGDVTRRSVRRRRRSRDRVASALVVRVRMPGRAGIAIGHGSPRATDSAGGPGG